MKLLEQISDDNFSVKEIFYINVHLTDHTGTIANVKLGDDITRKMLKCSVRTDLLLITSNILRFLLLNSSRSTSLF